VKAYQGDGAADEGLARLISNDSQERMGGGNSGLFILGEGSRVYTVRDLSTSRLGNVRA